MSPHRRRLLLWRDDVPTAGYGCLSCSGEYCVGVPCPSPPPPAFNTTDNNDADSIPISFNHKSRLVPNLLFAASGLLVASFLLLLATYAIHRLRRRRRLRRLFTAPAPPTGGGDDDGDLYEEGEADHHVWHIRTVGLDEATIRSIAACVYSSKEGLLGGGPADCAVCLAELRDGELLRLLPKCGHAFHLPCVDTWLRAHVNCPLCRAPVLAPAADRALSLPPPAVGAAEDTGSEPAHSTVMENTQIAIRDSETDQAAAEAKVTIGLELEVGSSSSPSNTGLLNNLAEDGLPPVRRSVSMDSSSLAALLLRGDSTQKPSEERVVIEIGEDQVVKNRGKQGNAVKGVALQKGPVQMKRSVSSRSGRFFLSRYARARNSGLPL